MLSWLENHLLPCALKSFAGIDCPLCGTQRSFIALIKGDFVRKLFYLPSIIFYPALLVVFGIVRG